MYSYFPNNLKMLLLGNPQRKLESLRNANIMQMQALQYLNSIRVYNLNFKGESRKE